MKNLTIVLLLLSIIACNTNKQKTERETTTLIQQLLTQRVSELINVEDDIVVRFKEGFDYSKINPNEHVRFSPSIDGTFDWIDDHTLRFDPLEYLPSDQNYTMNIDLTLLDLQSHEALKDLDELILNFKTKPLDLQMQQISHKLKVNGDEVDALISGSVLSNQSVDIEKIESVLRVSGLSTNAKINWTHSSAGRSHEFSIEGLQQKKEEQKLEITWNGTNIDDDFKGSKIINIAGKRSFMVDDVILYNDPNRHIVVIFSQPLREQQNINGLIRINSESKDLKTMIEGNQIKIFPDGSLSGTFDLSISKGVQSYNDEKLPADLKRALSIEPVKPELRLAESGVIVPNIGGVTFPFEAINIDTVDIEIFKIYDQNVLQFMQENSLSGQYNLSHVGTIVYQEKKSIKDASHPINTWKSVALDLNDYISSDPHAIYQVRLGFRPSYVTYECAEGKANFPPLEEGSTIMSYRYYDYSQQRNPCSAAYYNQDQFVLRNVILSDVAVIVKKDRGNRYHISTNKISDGSQLSNATVTFYDFQKLELGEVVTSNDGLAVSQLEKSAAFAIVKHQAGVAYMNLRDANAKSITDFNTGGKKSKSGIDAFMYTDRGVYRPGDSIYMHAMIHANDQPLPKGHPVTVTLKDPQGQVKYRYNTSDHLDQVYTFGMPTDANDVTGNWSATLSIGSLNFSKRISVETVKPNRLRMELDMDDRISYVDKSSRTIGIKSSWLHGAPAANLSAKIDAQWSVLTPRFENFKDYRFSDPARRINTSQVTLYEGKLNDAGEASFELSLGSNADFPAMLKANITSRVIEKGGDFSENYGRIEVSPYATYVGVSMPENSWGYKSVQIGDPASANAVVLDEKGSPAPNRQVSVGVYDIDWRWWYYRGQSSNIYELNSDQHTKAIIKTQATSGSNGKIQIPINTNDFEYGRKLIRICDIESGHCTGEFFYASGWRGSSMSSEERSSLSKLSFKAHKESYKAGEEVSLSIPSEAGSRILISIEGEDQVIMQDWISGEAGSSTYKFRTNKDMAPNVYAHVSLVQPYNQVTNDLPIRMYGVIPIMVEDPESIITPEIQTAESFKPEEPFSISVSEEEGRAMTYTIAIVDDGLLDLTNFKTPRPHGYFYAKRSLGVKTWDLYDDVLYGLNGTPDKIVSIGGDGEAGSDKGQKKAIRFKPVVFSAGPFRLEKGERKSHSFTMPNYIGSVRAMVVARDDHAYGTVQETVPVKTPLMLLPTVPRVLSQGEKIKIPVSVFGMQDDIKNVKINLATSGNLSSDVTTESLTFAQQGEQMVYFDADVSEVLGIAKIDVSASSGSYKASQQIEVDIRNPNPITSIVQGETIQPGATWTTTYQPVGVKGTNTGAIELSLMPSIRLADKVDYLVNYPYGCLEQTTSSAFSQLYLKDLTDYVSDANIDRNINTGIKRIGKLQNSAGGFKYWPRSRGKISEWSSSYAGHFLIEAKKKGYYVSSGVIDKWAEDQKNRASRWSPSSMTKWKYKRKHEMLSQSYRLYTLALYGAPELSAMNNLRSFSDLPATAKYLLAASYAMNGKSNIALDLITGAETDIKAYRDRGYTYGSGVRDMALISQALRHLDRKNQSLEVVKKIIDRLNSGSWYSTQSIAFGLMAVGQLSEDFRRSTINASITQSGERPIDVNYNKSIFTLEISPDETDERKVVIKNNSDKVLFASLQLSGKKSTSAMLTDAAVSENISIKVDYKNLKGGSIDVSSLEQGTDFIAEVYIKNLNTLETSIDELALTQIIPSGWEIRSGRLNKVEGATQDSYDYQDIRDDRVYTFFDMGNSKKYTLMLNATYEGEYFLPPVSVEAMYDKSVTARTQGQKVKVVKSKSL